ncbi:unnamed protein product [Clonostachys rosea]|uniref:Uncharacterized protein n=1 Tax=Bionectria ochroleuca TaxID=29856 RepID=A0ABY6UAZ3_BIOOC|nr:unnamed protein product [Clonostachys rosea]
MSRPAIRACLFDMDGLILNTEDIYTSCINAILERYGKPSLPWAIKAKLQGRPAPAANEILQQWAKLPISQEEFLRQYSEMQRIMFPKASALPGIPDLLANLERTRYWEETGDKRYNRVHIALATSSHTENFELKTGHLRQLFSVFPHNRRILGDDSRLKPGRGKPLPDIFLLALECINNSLAPGETPIRPEECLVFEDSVPGVEAGRRAGMRVVWCPHPMLKEEYKGREQAVLAGLTGEADGGPIPTSRIDDGWAEHFKSLVDFPYDRYGIVLPPTDVY